MKKMRKSASNVNNAVNLISGAYREHLEMMKRFSQMHKNYHIEENKSPAFRHIQILIHEGSWAIVSKEKTPAIHFVIRHPKMREAMENITMPIVEGEEYK